MIVLGIDPGLANTGYGVVQRRDGRLVASTAQEGLIRELSPTEEQRSKP